MATPASTQKTAYVVALRCGVAVMRHPNGRPVLLGSAHGVPPDGEAWSADRLIWTVVDQPRMGRWFREVHGTRRDFAGFVATQEHPDRLTHPVLFTCCCSKPRHTVGLDAVTAVTALREAARRGRHAIYLPRWTQE
ncbi:MAG: hypothetical protein KatS3mg011_1260 [Acidimicrobiia bacterium]|nr:MAG: hypothetical protein KatS3mg011_1260 [Acidimicrobiia bacterium]